MKQFKQPISAPAIIGAIGITFGIVGFMKIHFTPDALNYPLLLKELDMIAAIPGVVFLLKGLVLGIMVLMFSPWWHKRCNIFTGYKPAPRTDGKAGKHLADTCTFAYMPPVFIAFGIMTLTNAQAVSTGCFDYFIQIYLAALVFGCAIFIIKRCYAHVSHQV